EVHMGDGRHQLAHGRVLEEEPARPGPERGVGVLVEIEGGQDQHVWTFVARADLPCGLHTAHPWHPNVHEHHVRVHGLLEFQCGVAVVGLTDDLDPRLGLEDHPKAHADHLLVVDQHNAYRHFPSSIGNVADTSNPPPGRG